MMASNTLASSSARMSSGKIAFERPVEMTSLMSVVASAWSVVLLCSAITPPRLKVSSISKKIILGTEIDGLAVWLLAATGVEAAGMRILVIIKAKRLSYSIARLRQICLWLLWGEVVLSWFFADYPLWTDSTMNRYRLGAIYRWQYVKTAAMAKSWIDFLRFAIIYTS